MADQKISQLTELTTFPALDDESEIRDVSEAPAAENKRIKEARTSAPSTRCWEALYRSEEPVTVSIRPIRGFFDPEYTIPVVLASYTPLDDQVGEAAGARVVFREDGMVSRTGFEG